MPSKTNLDSLCRNLFSRALFTEQPQRLLRACGGAREWQLPQDSAPSPSWLKTRRLLVVRAAAR